MSSDARNTRRENLRKTKAQLVDEMEALERKVTDQTSSESDAIWQTALDNMSGGIFLYDKDLRVQIANQNFQHYFQFPDKMVLRGAPAIDLLKFRVEAMGGRIGYETEIDQGSTFWVEFPVADQSPNAASVPFEIPKAGHTNTSSLFPNTVLYIEDNPANLNQMGAIVGGISGLTLISVPNAELGLLMVEEHQPNLILMDINLPGMDGIAAMNILREKEKLAIFLSSRSRQL